MCSIWLSYTYFQYSLRYLEYFEIFEECSVIFNAAPLKLHPFYEIPVHGLRLGDEARRVDLL